MYVLLSIVDIFTGLVNIMYIKCNIMLVGKKYYVLLFKIVHSCTFVHCNYSLCVQECMTVEINVEILLPFVWVMYVHQCAVQ
jgi:hypothetical protein